MRRYYLDYNATAPLDPAAQAAMAACWADGMGNPSSLHAEGRRARAVIDAARAEVANLLGCREHEIVFTGGGTESNNLAVRGIALAAEPRRGGRHLVTSAGEHHAVLHTCESLAARHGFGLTVVSLEPDGRVDPERVRQAIRDDTVLVTVMSANNETGARNPVEQIGEVCSRMGVLFHTDAVQSAGKEPLRPAGWQAAAMSLAGHKFGGPVGAGILYLRAGIPIRRLMEGGSHENERRPGTENVGAIAGMAAALRVAESRRTIETPRQFGHIERLWDSIREVGGVRRNGNAVERMPNTLNASFDGVDGEELLIGLDLEGLAVSSGSACLVGSVQTSHVLRAMGRTEAEARATVRFSIGAGLRDDDVAEIAARVRRVVTAQRAARREGAG